MDSTKEQIRQTVVWREEDFETDERGVKTNKRIHEIVGVGELKKGARVKIKRDGGLEDGWIIFKFLRDKEGNINVDIRKRNGEETMRETFPLEEIIR